MKPLTSNAWTSLPGPENISRFELPNGIILLTRSNFDSPSVVITGYLPGGGMFDPEEKLGLANFTALCLMRGTVRWSFQELFDQLESMGANLGFGASMHNISFGGRCLTEDLPTLLNLFSECMRNPTFPVDQVERLRYQVLTSLAIRAQDTADMASLEFNRVLFGSHPYARPEDGYPETIQNISREDIQMFHRTHFSPQDMVVVMVGAIDPNQAYDLLLKTLGDWSSLVPVQFPVLPAIEKLTQTVRRHLPIPGKLQSDLVMGTFGPRRNSSDYVPGSLGNDILGQFGLMGRIGDVVREQAGLAYYASTSLNAWIESGTWEVSAGINPINLQRAIDLIIQELERFRREPVTKDEIEDSQSNFIGRLPLSMESNFGVASALLKLERFELGLDYYQKYPDMIRKVTPEMILETAHRYLDLQALCIISAGPQES